MIKKILVCLLVLVVITNIAQGGNNTSNTSSSISFRLVPSISPTPTPCFIATAAYGTPLHEDIDVLRSFRNEYLMTNLPGKIFIKIYYTISPSIADVISENNRLRTIVREGFVKPLVNLVLFIQEREG